MSMLGEALDRFRTADSPDPLRSGYEAETRKLMQRRVPVAVLIFLFFIGVSNVLDGYFYPQRATAIVFACSAYVLICLVQVIAVRRIRDVSVPVTQIATNLLSVCISIYFGVVQSTVEPMVITLALFVTGIGIFYPWGLRGQLGGCIGAFVGFPVALGLGAVPLSPIPSEFLGLVTAASVAGLGAYLIDRQRFSTYQHAIQSRQEQAFSAALVEVGHELAAATRDPRVLAEQLTEHARTLLGADWAFLYQRAWDEPVFRIAAASQAPPAATEEIRTLEISGETLPELLRVLEGPGTAELQRNGNTAGIGALLQRWQVSRLAVQAIGREQEIIGILGWCYTTRTTPFDARERRLMTAIANQAAVALQNARLMEEARRANQLKSEFIATVSHELRTPLSIILGYTELLRGDAFDPSCGEQAEMLDRVHDQSMQLLSLIQSLLDLNRLEAHRLPISIEAFTIGELMADVRHSVPQSWSKDGVLLHWKVSNEAAVLESDRGKLQIVLRNLIHNALKHTDTGSVTVTAEPRLDQRRIAFAVADTGPGITAEEQAVIFEMFRQGSRSSPGRGGVGLGLYIVKRLTEALGGQVMVDSRAGMGARFLVSVPIQPRDGRL